MRANVRLQTKSQCRVVDAIVTVKDRRPLASIIILTEKGPYELSIYSPFFCRIQC